MFANVAHHQPPFFFSPLPRYLNERGFKDSSSRLDIRRVTQDDQNHGTQNEDMHQRSQRTQPFGQPIYRPHFNLRQKEQGDGRGPPGDGSEYMLRRKTPTGTLAAGYDGRPVEWSGRPHATKHFLMPIPSTVGEVAYQSVPIAEPAGHPRKTSLWESDTTAQDQCHRLNGATAENIEHRDAIPSDDLRSKLPQPVGLDSVLNQGTWSHPFGGLAWEPRNPTVLQPMWPPSLGFTALNDPEQYGHRWPGEGYAFHRLAAFQAPFQYPPLIEPHALASTYQQFASGNLSQRDFNPREMNLHENPGQEFHGGMEPEFPEGNLDEEENRSGVLTLQNGHPIPPHQRFSLVHRAKPRSTKSLPDGYASYRNPPPAFQAVSHCGIQTASNFRSGAHTDQARFKEKILIWAHRVYGSLVASTQQARRNLRDSHQHGDRRLATCLFPKPPRIPHVNSVKDGSVSCDHEGTQSRNEFTREIRDQINYHEPRWQRNPAAYNHPPGDFNAYAPGLVGNRPCQGLDLRHQQQLNEGQHSSLKLISSITTETPPASVSTSFVLPHESSILNAATKALEILDGLCKESGWKWTEGMLLGGCLAYGLSDYDKAMKWYLKVLSDDSK